MSVLQICGAALLTAVLSSVLRAAGGGGGAALLSALGGMGVLLLAVERYRKPIEVMLQMGEEAGIRAATETVLRMLAIGFISAVAAEVCRDMGEGTLAARVELLGRAEILLLCLPFLSELFSLALSLVS